MNKNELNDIQQNLEQKLGLLDQIYEVTLSQTELLASQKINVSVFDATMDEIGLYTDRLVKLDENMEADLGLLEAKADYYKKNDPDLINKIRNLSDTINERCESIRKLVSDNMDKIDGYLAGQRRDVSRQKKSVAGIRGYFKSMGGLSTESKVMDNRA